MASLKFITHPFIKPAPIALIAALFALIQPLGQAQPASINPNDQFIFQPPAIAPPPSQDPIFNGLPPESTIQTQAAMMAIQERPDYNRLPEIENRLFGHSYNTETLNKRLGRIERSLFGDIQKGDSANRMLAISRKLKENSDRASQGKHDPMVSYLETKLFQRTFERKPLPDRLSQLELQVFGRSFGEYPSPLRIKKLTYAMPLMVKQVRLTRNDGEVIARTPDVNQASRQANQGRAVQSTGFEELSLSATEPAHSSSIPGKPVSGISALPQAKSLSRAHPKADSSLSSAPVPQQQRHPEKQSQPFPKATTSSYPRQGQDGDFVQTIYRTPDGTVLRWQHLPVRVYLKPIAQGAFQDTPDSGTEALFQKAMDSWSSSVPLAAVSDAAQSDIIISWQQTDWMQNTHGLITRPVAQLDDQKRLQTVIFINLYPLLAEPDALRLHALNHSLGHALGIWGHSPNPEDLMHPALEAEHGDFPEPWAWRSRAVEHDSAANRQNAASHRIDSDDWRPSSRDVETMRKIYDLPATDIRLEKLPLAR